MVTSFKNTYFSHVCNGVSIVHQFSLIHLYFSQAVKSNYSRCSVLKVIYTYAYIASKNFL